MPTYHLANVVDDHLMEISHVVRGEEWLPSLALHVLLYKAFEWKMPVFAHLPLILKPSGKGKLSKRDGAKFGFPVYPLSWEEDGVVYKGFKDEGYLPEGLNNYMVFLGWNNDEEKEIYSANELIEKFDLSGINKSGSKFNLDKLNWINSHHIQLMSDQILSEIVSSQMGVGSEQSILITKMIKPRLEKLSGLKNSFRYLLKTPNLDSKVLSKIQNNETIENLSVAVAFFKEQNVVDKTSLKDVFFEHLSSSNIKPGKILPAIRIALVGKLEGPDLFELISFFGSKEVYKRLVNLINAI